MKINKLYIGKGDEYKNLKNKNVVNIFKIIIIASLLKFKLINNLTKYNIPSSFINEPPYLIPSSK